LQSSDVFWRIYKLAQKLSDHRMVLQGAPVVYLCGGLEYFINWLGAAKLRRVHSVCGF
jgi:acyl-CoA synthetase (AMP-forming)/AMP-acid ligase II